MFLGDLIGYVGSILFSWEEKKKAEEALV